MKTEVSLKSANRDLCSSPSDDEQIFNEYLLESVTDDKKWIAMCNSSLQEVKPTSLPLKLGQSRDLLWPIKHGRSDGMLVLSLGLLHC